jgi:uncharacterized membrane protein
MRTLMARRVGLVFVVLFFLLGGIAHFVFAAAEISVIPPYVPYPRVVNFLSGVFEILGAIGLMISYWRRAAAVGLILLTICVTPANVSMFQHAQQFPDLPFWALAIRIPLQGLLILLIGWSSGIAITRRC